MKMISLNEPFTNNKQSCPKHNAEPGLTRLEAGLCYVQVCVLMNFV